MVGVLACKNDKKECAKNAPAISKLFAMAQLTRLDLENYEKTKSTVNSLLHMTVLSKSTTKRRTFSQKILEQPEKDYRRLQIVESKSPFVSLCLVPYVRRQMNNGTITKTEYYSPDYTVVVDPTVKRNLSNIDSKMMVRKYDDLPAPPPEIKKHVSHDNTCKIAFRYGLSSTSKIYDNRVSKICPMVKNSCCKKFEMVRFFEEYSPKKNPSSGIIHKISQCSESRLYITGYLVQSLIQQGLSYKAEVGGSPYCRQNATTKEECTKLRTDLVNQTLAIQEFLPAYEREYKKCWESISRMRMAGFCMACDADNQKVIDTGNKEVHVTEKV